MERFEYREILLSRESKPEEVLPKDERGRLYLFWWGRAEEGDQ
jgi:hypothetical protein